MAQAKAAGKLRADFEIPPQFSNNRPETVVKVIRKYQAEGLFPRFPFGTDLTTEEQQIGRALKALKKKSYSKPLLIKALFKALVTFDVPTEFQPLLERMQLWQPKSLHERLYRNLLANELKAQKAPQS